MPSERVTLQSDGTAAVKRGGFGIGNVLIGLGLLALVAVIVFIVSSAHRDQALRTDAVTSAASDLAAQPPPPAPR
ncbi:hypothetical protein [Phenylobacterium sp.]|uniref:hypothetical protein n=1 Tax=Phenylobacterium sp. TaxID=1871053 RepID=UPI00374D4F24